MEVVYVDGKQPKSTHPSIFLAGPTPRSTEDKSWRPEALEIFNDFGFPGQVYVPERSNWKSNFEYHEQVDWEWSRLHGVDTIMFWVPRVLPEFPGFTTNVEFGLYLGLRPMNVVYGRPDISHKNRYLDWLYEKITAKKPYTDLRSTVAASITHADNWVKNIEDLWNGKGNP